MSEHESRGNGRKIEMVETESIGRTRTEENRRNRDNLAHPAPRGLFARYAQSADSFIVQSRTISSLKVL
jgi:hypothetical protein